MSRLFKVLFAIFFFAAFAFVSAKLFFEPQLNELLKRFSFSEKPSVSGELIIGVAEPMTDFDPTSNNVANRERLLNIYEGLTRLDKNLNILPGLAVAFGSIDDRTWEFRLRPNVSFHDGLKLTVEDVVASITRALSDIESVSAPDAFRIIIKTKTPDPLMLQKIASVMIFPKGKTNEIMKTPIGTGPYQFISSQNGELKLKRFEAYWGKLPSYTSVNYKTFESRDSRKDAYEKGEVTILTDFPPELVALQKSGSMKVVTAPTLEINFLLFGMNGIFKNKNLRRAATIAFDRKEVAKLGFGFAKPISQFAGSGIFGYDPGIDFPEVDSKEALEMVSKETEGKRLSASFYLPQGLKALGDFLKERFRQIGIDVDVHFLSQEKLLEKVESQDGDLVFLGWRMDLGDTSDFFGSVIHSRTKEYGGFNAGDFQNKTIDQMIEETQNILKPLDRLKKMRTIMKKIVEDEIVGIPLFSPEALYAVSSNIEFSPRIDGYVFAAETQGK